MTAPKVSREEVADGLRHNASFLRGWGAEARARQLEHAADLFCALEPEPSAVRLTEQEERLGYMMPKFKPSAVDELLRAAEHALAEPMEFQGAVWIALWKGIAAVRRERGEGR